MEKHLSTVVAVAAAVAAMAVSTGGAAQADGPGSYPVTVGKQTIQASQAEHLRQERQRPGAIQSRAAVSVAKPRLAVVTVGKANLPAVRKDGQLISAWRPAERPGSVAQRQEPVSARTETGRFEQRGKAAIWVPRSAVVEALDDRRTATP